MTLVKEAIRLEPANVALPEADVFAASGMFSRNLILFRNRKEEKS